jgi:RHS repeat-associated protein
MAIRPSVTILVYGNPGSGNTGTFQHTGQMYMPLLGLYYYRARYYSPQLGRFLQVDPVGYKDDVDLYTYVGNDPADKSDPSGKTCTQGDDKKYICVVDSMKDAKGNVTQRADFSKAQLRQVAGFEKSYTVAVNALASHPGMTVELTNAGTGVMATTNAGSVATALAGRNYMAIPSLTSGPGSAQGTIGNTTSVGGVGLSGSGMLPSVPGANTPELMRQVETVHEGLHGPATGVDALRPSSMDFNEWNKVFHQPLYDEAAWSLLTQLPP